jgi:hypothetical protein
MFEGVRLKKNSFLVFVPSTDFHDVMGIGQKILRITSESQMFCNLQSSPNMVILLEGSGGVRYIACTENVKIHTQTILVEKPEESRWR